MNADSYPGNGEEDEFARAQGVKRAHEEQLLAKANVVGVGIGLQQRAGQPTGKIALVVMVREKLPPASLSPEDILPAEIEGVPVDVQEAGEIDIQP